MRTISLIIPFLLILGACSPGKIYEEHLDTRGLVWNRFDVKVFDVEIQDIDTEYDILVAIRHHTDIPYRNLDIYFNMETPSGETRNNSFRIPVKDAEGKNLGNGMGALWDLNFLAWEGFRFTEPGICRIEVSSAMSQADLAGIMQVGLIVRKR